MELGEVEHQTGQECLTGALSGLPQSSWEPQGDGCVTFPYFHGCRQTQHVVDGGLHQADSAGDARADDVRALLGLAAVALGVKPGDPVALHAECDGGHAQKEILPISTLV